jgi:hypothetical protein
VKPSEAIREGRNRLLERGWCQDVLEEADGSLCSVGAIRSAVLGDTDRTYDPAAMWVCKRAVATLSDAAGVHIPVFNDAPGRTFDEVIDVFDKAEKLAEQAESSG